MKLPKISLEQWCAFKAVVDEGSFAKAAEALNKSQSSISYALARMEEQVPTPLLTLQGRKAALTEAGKLMYRRATQLLEQAQETEQTLLYLASGWESEVVIAVDAIVPVRPLLCGLEQFAREHPLTRVRLLETALSGTDEALLLKQADLVLTSRILPGFFGDKLVRVQMVAAAAPDHPLCQMEEITEGELRRHRQIVVRDSGTKRVQDAGWLGSEQRWTVSHFATSILAVREGLGFAFLPRHDIERELAAGALQLLRLAAGFEREALLYLVKTLQDSAGPAASAVAKKIVAAFASAPE